MTAPTPSRRAEILPRITFFAACLFFAFLYGFATSHYKWFPHGFLSQALSQGETAAVVPDLSTHHVHPVKFDLRGVKTYGAAAGDGAGDGSALRSTLGSTLGSTLLTSYWPDRDGLPGLRLIDASGKTLHHWDANPKAIWPESPHQDAVRGMLNSKFNYVHGSHLFANGDVLFNIEYLGVVRLDARGRMIWRLDRRTHHSVHRDEDGNFWVCGVNWIDNDQQLAGRFPGLRLPIAEDFAVRVSPDGKILEEISMLEAVFAGELKHLLWRDKPPRFGDHLHMNDVEPLSTAMAADYPTLSAGDLLVSLRNLDAVAVLDRQTRRFKWSVNSPFRGQHDPDFIGDGWISVFDNNFDGAAAGPAAASRLLAFRPHTGEHKQLYPVATPSGHERPFFTKHGGKAQLLDNGHWVVTDAVSARVFEIDRSGHTTWEWGQSPHANGTKIFEVLEGTRYPYTGADVSRWPK
jgi:hypothetical protein